MTKYTKRISVGAFLKKGEDFRDGDFVEIANEGKKTEGQFGEQDIFLLKLKDGREGNVSFNQTTLNNLIDGYGEDSIKWIGKKTKVWGILQNVQGKMIRVYYFLHPDTILNEKSGEFILVAEREDTGSPVKEDGADEELPF